MSGVRSSQPVDGQTVAKPIGQEPPIKPKVNVQQEIVDIPDTAVVEQPKPVIQDPGGLSRRKEVIKNTAVLQEDPNETGEETSEETTEKMGDRKASAMEYGGDRRCPRCGWDTAVPLGVPEDEDIKEYLRCVLGDRQFEKTYDLFGGAASVTFQELTKRQSDGVYIAMRMYIRSASEEESAMHMADVTMKNRAAACINRLVVGEKTIEPDAFNGEVGELAQRVAETLDTLRDTIYAAVLSVFREFDMTVGILAKRASDTDFWKGVGPV